MPRSFSSLNTQDDVAISDSQLWDLSSLSNEELADTSTIPGWDLVHTPPRVYPRGALLGKVVSDKMNKTVNVAVERYRIVPKYRKRVKYTRKFMAHDENEVANLGDLVLIVPCHRISRHKHFMLREIVRPKGQL
jgi:small subunit ribosomal protein S17